MGVNSHGINRVPLFLEYVRKGKVNIDAEAERIASFGSIERWEFWTWNNQCKKVYNPSHGISQSSWNGYGSFAKYQSLDERRHIWMDGSRWGCISILFTNTKPNMPPWGGKDSRIGNNPFIVSIPRKEGHIVLDMAISQFSFGKIHEHKLKDDLLPYPGGWDENNELSKDPEKILKKERGLPIGYWKGSALSMVLDMLATILSAGDSTFRIGQKDTETGISQVYLCIDPERFQDKRLQENLLNEIIDYTHDVDSMSPGDKTYYPGERRAQIRKRNLEKGVPVNEKIWQAVLELLD